MKQAAASLALLLAMLALAPAFAQNAAPPSWAYGFDAATGAPAAPPAAADDGSPRQLAGSSASFTSAQIRDAFGPADWYPQDHRPMPDVVAHGRRPDVRACSLCHYPNGKGRPENAGIAGLPRAYFLQAMADFRAGTRASTDRRKTNTGLMAAIATAMTDEEIAAAADYFTSMTWTPWIRVVETPTVPKTRTSAGMFIALPGAGREPIGSRLIEVPEDAERTENFRDPRAGFVAYVAPGTIARGEALARTGAGRATACIVCHGTDLRGSGPIPGLAGRSPSYAVRQLYDMQQGTRHGAWSDLMKPIVTALSVDDLAAVAAYSASLR